MMYAICVLILSASFISNTAFGFAGEKNVSIVEYNQSIIHHGKERLESLKGNGRVTLDETQIVGYVEVNGSLFAQGAHFGSATINGQATLYNTTVEGKCTIGGCICAEDCTFRSRINAAAQKLSFTDCNINSIHLEKMCWPNSPQVVELSKCNCRGNIEFASGKGLVIITDGSEIQGQVIGGNVKRS